MKVKSHTKFPSSRCEAHKGHGQRGSCSTPAEAERACAAELQSPGFLSELSPSPSEDDNRRRSNKGGHLYRTRECGMTAAAVNITTAVDPFTAI